LLSGATAVPNVIVPVVGVTAVMINSWFEPVAPLCILIRLPTSDWFHAVQVIVPDTAPVCG